MTEKCSGIYSPVLVLVEARGNPSARSSVSINACWFCNPDACIPQEFPTSGFYAELTHAVSDVLSTVSGLCLKLKTSPTVVRIRSQLRADFSLRDAATFHFLTGLEQSTPHPHRDRSPLRGLVPPAETCRRLIVIPEVTHEL